MRFGGSAATSIALASSLLIATFAVSGPAVGSVASGTVQVNPAVPIEGERVLLSGRFPSPRSRPVQLQTYNGIEWRNLSGARTNATGNYSLATSALAAGTSSKLRLYAPRFRGAAAAVTRAITLTPVKQRATVVGPDRLRPPVRANLTTHFVPARPGRSVSLQRRTNGGWQPVQSDRESSDGSIVWKVNSAGAYRAVAAAYHGAEAVSASHVLDDVLNPEVWKVTDSCRQVVWLGARGSGEPVTQGEGQGSEVFGAWKHYAQTIGQGADVGFYSVRFPALAAGPQQAAPAYQAQFAASIDQGVDDVLGFLQDRASHCRDEHYVLAGYSQGAMVMHRALFQMAQADGGHSDRLDRIDGVVAIADGDKVANQGGTRYSTASTDAFGISFFAPWASNVGKYDSVNQPLPDIDPFPATRFHDICYAHDLVCDVGVAALIEEGLDIHGNAYRTGGTTHYAEKALSAVYAASEAVASASLAVLNPDPVGEFCAAQAGLSPLECQALKDIADQNPIGMPVNNWVDGDPCSWTGVTCADHHVTSLDISSSIVDGKIPSSIGNLQHLTYLNIAADGITSLPDSLAKLKSLQELHAWSNNLEVLPANIGGLASMRYLDFQFNHLTALPASIGDMDELESLVVDFNSLTTVPATIGDMTRLRNIFLYNNPIESLPTEFGQLSNLSQAMLQNMELSGDISNWAGPLSRNSPGLGAPDSSHHYNTFNLTGNGCLNVAGGDEALLAFMNSRSPGWQGGCA